MKRIRPALRTFGTFLRTPTLSRSIIERFRGQTVVMSQNEIHPKVRIKTVGQV